MVCQDDDRRSRGEFPAALDPRPTSGFTPSVANRSPLTRATTTCAGWMPELAMTLVAVVRRRTPGTRWRLLTPRTRHGSTRMRQRSGRDSRPCQRREDAHQLLRRGIRQRTDQHPIDDGEDGCVESDARANDSLPRPWRPDGVGACARHTRIPSGIVHPPERPGIAVQLLA